MSAKHHDADTARIRPPLQPALRGPSWKVRIGHLMSSLRQRLSELKAAARSDLRHAENSPEGKRMERNVRRAELDAGALAKTEVAQAQAGNTSALGALVAAVSLGGALLVCVMLGLCRSLYRCCATDSSAAHDSDSDVEGDAAPDARRNVSREAGGAAAVGETRPILPASGSRGVELMPTTTGAGSLGAGAEEELVGVAAASHAHAAHEGGAGSQTGARTKREEAQAFAAAAQRKAEEERAEMQRQHDEARAREQEREAAIAAEARARATVVSVLEEHEMDEEAAQWL